VTFVESKHIERVVAVRQHHVGCIGEVHTQISILKQLSALPRPRARSRTRRGGMSPVRLLRARRVRPLSARPRSQQIVEFCQHEGRQDQRFHCPVQRLFSGVVKTLAGINGGEQPAGVEDEYRSPKPASTSSTPSASVGSPLENRGNRERGGSESSTRRLFASRMSSASLRSLSVARRPSADLKSSGR
jgi:hypothetical protein